MAIGWSLDYFGVCPMVKRIWTPSWAIFSAGGSLLMLAVFYLLTDFVHLRLWAWPLIVVGMNSIVMYCMSMVMTGWLRGSLETHAGYPQAMQLWERLTPDGLEQRLGIDFSQGLFDLFGSHYHDFLVRALPLFLMWLICVWLYRQRIFVRI
jgi:predicted acyltransferase